MRKMKALHGQTVWLYDRITGAVLERPPRVREIAGHTTYFLDAQAAGVSITTDCVVGVGINGPVVLETNPGNAGVLLKML